MRRRRYFVGLIAALTAASTMILAAAPAGAASACDENMNPASESQMSGLIVTCQFDGAADAGTGLNINDYASAVWHSGAAREVWVRVARTGTAPGVVSGKTTVTTCPTNNTSTASTAVCPTPGSPAGHLAIGQADVNHSLEYPSSTTTFTGIFIDPGTFIKSVVGTTVTLSRTTIASPAPGTTGAVPACPGTYATGCLSAPFKLLLANHSGRDVRDATTAVDSPVVTSANAHFCAVTYFTGASSDVALDTITKAGHVLAANTRIRLTGLTTTTGVTNGTTYFAVSVVAGTSFKVSLTSGGAAINLTGSNQAATISVGPSNLDCGTGATQVSDIDGHAGGGTIPDGATIASVDSPTQVTLTCTGCAGGGFVGNVLKAPDPSTIPPTPAVILGISRSTAPTSNRFVVDAQFNNTRTICSVTAGFADTDIGLRVVAGAGSSPATVVSAGSRIVSVGGVAAPCASGTSATLETGPAVLATGSNRFITIGVATKTAPALNETAANLSIVLGVDPLFSPTSPPCSAQKPTAADIQLLWKGPGSYDTASNGSTKVAGAVISPTSIAQLDFVTNSTTFAGFVKQAVTVTAGVPVTTRYSVRFEFLPVGIALCSGTALATGFNAHGITPKQVQLPPFTGGGAGVIRGLNDEPQGTSTLYSGASGAVATTIFGSVPTNANSCTLTSPVPVQHYCQ